MNNLMKYFYGLNMITIKKYNDNYIFNYDNHKYIFSRYDRDKRDIKGLIEICEELKKRNILTNELICNKFNNYLTPYNGVLYVLVKENIKEYIIDLNDILYIQNNTFNISMNKNLIRINNIELWKNKIDFYEKKSKEISSKYSLINKTIDYYIGLGENAIVYLINNNISINNIVLSHRRLKEFYNPLNYILDSRARDIADYIKQIFFYENINNDVILSLLRHIDLNREEYILLIARMLYPTHYFDLLDDILIKKYDEEMLKRIIKKNDDYIILIKQIFYFINYDLRMNIPIIEWIIKK